jgi:hypothetical protein
MEDIVRHCRLNTIPTNFHGLKYSNKKGDASHMPNSEDGHILQLTAEPYTTISHGREFARLGF